MWQIFRYITYTFTVYNGKESKKLKKGRKKRRYDIKEQNKVREKEIKRGRKSKLRSEKETQSGIEKEKTKVRNDKKT